MSIPVDKFFCNNKMKHHLKNLIQTIKTGLPAEVKFAQKQVEKFWRNYYIPNREEGRMAFSVFVEELKNFEQIRDIDHQAYFINTLKWPLWSISEEYFEDWVNFFLFNIQHPSGKIRQAVIHATEYLMLNISVDLRHVGEKEKDLSPHLKELVLKNKMRFGYFVMEVEALIDQYHEPRFKRYKYVSSLPTGVYKSLSKLITEVLLRSEFYEKLYQDFLNELRAKRKKMELPKFTLVEIFEKRNQMEKDLANLIKKTGNSVKMENIKDIIYNETGQESILKIIDNFDKGQNTKELNNILDIISSAWNCWPHKSLNGLSPAEKSLEF